MEEKLLKIFKNIPEDQTFESLIGVPIEEQKENLRIADTSEKYFNVPPSEWPEFEIKWDLSTKNMKFALDHFDDKTFQKHYPEGLTIGWITLDELMKKMASHSQRTKDQLWETSSVGKLAKTILYFVEGNAMTPPLITHKNGFLLVGGGFHRIGVSLGKDLAEIPILVIPSEKEEINAITSKIRWKDM